MHISDWPFVVATAVGLLVAAITAVIVNVVCALAHSINTELRRCQGYDCPSSEQDEEFTFEDDFPGG
jgi:hypothetical protein